MRSPEPIIRPEGMRVKRHHPRGQVNVEALPVPTPIPYTKLDPSPWNRADRSTPGMTNRLLEDRLPENPYPFNYESTEFETPEYNQEKVMPEVLRRQRYLHYAIGAMAVFAIYSFVYK